MAALGAALLLLLPPAPHSWERIPCSRCVSIPAFLISPLLSPLSPAQENLWEQRDQRDPMARAGTGGCAASLGNGGSPRERGDPSWAVCGVGPVRTAGKEHFPAGDPRSGVVKLWGKGLEKEQDLSEAFHG